MSAVASAANAVSPIGDHSRLRRIGKVVGWIAVATLVFVLLDVLGVDIGGWLGGLWDTLSEVSPPYLIGAIAVQTVQIVGTAIAWLFILRAGYPHAKIAFAPILAAYAVGGALNAIVPAQIGSFVMLFMFIAIIPGATFAGVFAAFLVEKIFFTVAGALVYVYLFATVPGSFSVELGGLRDHPWLTSFIVIGGTALIVFVGRFFWERLRKLWLDAKQGGAILATPRKYLVQVVLPCFVSYLARLGVIAIMLAAFAIPVSFNSVMHVVAGNSIAGNTAATPGGAGVNQAIAVVALKDYTDPQTATAYSVAQQLLATAWGITFALILVLSVFGWTNGRAMVKTAYSRAKEHQHDGEQRGSPSDAASAAEAKT
jgi:glycosyltransferase 2 family protein